MTKIYALQIDQCLIETHIELFKKWNSIYNYTDLFIKRKQNEIKIQK